MRVRQSSDAGSAILEFLVIGVLVLMPLLYLLLTILRVESAVMATTQAVREAGRAFVTSDSASQGRTDAAIAAQLAMADQGFDLPQSALRITCRTICLVPGSTVHVQLAWRVDLPWLPPFLAEQELGYPITVESDLRVDSYRSEVPA
jgi:hypothetical protein